MWLVPSTMWRLGADQWPLWGNSSPGSWGNINSFSPSRSSAYSTGSSAKVWVNEERDRKTRNTRLLPTSRKTIPRMSDNKIGSSFHGNVIKSLFCSLLISFVSVKTNNEKRTARIPFGRQFYGSIMEVAAVIQNSVCFRRKFSYVLQCFINIYRMCFRFCSTLPCFSNTLLLSRNTALGTY